MPVTIKIDDGPAASPWLSQSVIPGKLTGNNFVAASGNSLQKNQTFDFKVIVRNTGNQATVPPTGSGPTGAFVASSGVVVGGNSPTGNSTASVSYMPGFPQLQLFNAAGTVIWSLTLGAATAVPHLFGYSPSGKVFMVVTENPAGILNVNAVAVEPIGVGAGKKNPGDSIDTMQISSSQGAMQWASTGWGFVPTQDVLYLTWASAGGTAFQLINLGPNVPQRKSALVDVSAGQAGQVLFSPSGDVMALIGQPNNLNNDILLYKTPSLSSLAWTRLGMSVPQLQVQLPVSLKAVKPAGFEAIEVKSGANTSVIDSPTPGLPAVAVYLWVDTSSSVFSSVTAKQFPQGTASSTQPPSGFIDRIGANGSQNAIIDANWLATLPPPGQHFCAIAEAFTTQGTQPADPRHRPSTALNLSEDQIAQRNLVVM